MPNRPGPSIEPVSGALCAPEIPCLIQPPSPDRPVEAKRIDPTWLGPFQGPQLDLWVPDPEVQRVLHDLSRLGVGEPWLVGGPVRDGMIGRPLKDVDVVMVGATEEGLLSIPSVQKKVGKSFPVFVYKDPVLGNVDLALPRRETKTGDGHGDFKCEVVSELSEDLLRRDFTVNAMAWNLEKGLAVCDPRALEDLQNRVLRHVSPAFVEDPLRVLRAARFSAQLGTEWTVARESIEHMAGMGEKLRHLSKDRIREELVKALASSAPSRFFEVLREVEGLDHWFPEVKGLIDVDHGLEHHPEGDAWNHTLMVLDRARRPDLDCGPMEMLAALSHDFGKALVDPAKWPKMHGHGVLGREPIGAFCARLGIGVEAEMRGAANFHHTLHDFEKLRPGSALDLVLAFRRGKLSADGFSRVAMADAQGRGGAKGQEPYPQRDLFLKVIAAVQSVKLAHCGGDRERIRQAQTDAVRVVMKGPNAAPAKPKSPYSRLMAALQDPELEPIQAWLAAEGMTWEKEASGIFAQAAHDLDPSLNMVCLVDVDGCTEHVLLEKDGRYMNAKANYGAKEVMAAFPGEGLAAVRPFKDMLMEAHPNRWFAPLDIAAGRELDFRLNRVLQRHLGVSPGPIKDPQTMGKDAHCLHDDAVMHGTPGLAKAAYVAHLDAAEAYRFDGKTMKQLEHESLAEEMLELLLEMKETTLIEAGTRDHVAGTITMTFEGKTPSVVQINAVALKNYGVTGPYEIDVPSEFRGLRNPGTISMKVGPVDA